MPSDAELSSLQIATRSVVERLGAARSCSGALRRGTYRTLHAGVEDLVFAREAPGVETVVVVAERNPARALDIPLENIPPGDYVDLVGGGHVTVGTASTKLPLAAYSVALFVPAASTCAKLVTP